MTEQPEPPAQNPLPANQNPFYVLATLYGEQTGENIDWDLHTKNRKAWNAWAGRNMTDEERAAAVRSSQVLFEQDSMDERQFVSSPQKITVEELSAWEQDKAEIENQFRQEWKRRNGTTDSRALSELGIIEFSDVEFTHILSVSSFVFPYVTRFENPTFKKYASFTGATFRASANFFNATFCQAANFNIASFNKPAGFSATFCDHTFFRYTTFHGKTEFGGARFKSGAGFYRATFSAEAVFSNAKFCASAWFSQAKFDNDVTFNSATFSGAAIFSDATFNGEAVYVDTKFEDSAIFNDTMFGRLARFNRTNFGQTGGAQKVRFDHANFNAPASFRDAKFRATYPIFAGAVMQDKNLFTAKPEYWPEKTSQNTEEARESCGAIRHMLEKQGLPEDAHFFFRREMDFAGLVGSCWQRLPYRTFGALSYYGHSIARPFWWLIGLTTFCLVVMGVWLNWGWLMRWYEYGVIPDRAGLEITLPLGVSFSNSLPFLGLGRLIYAEFHQAAPFWINALSALQSLFGIVLVFLLGLGLRNRFRMR